MSVNKMYEINYALLFKNCHIGNLNYIREHCNFELINIQDKNGMTLTSLACKNDNTSMLRELLKFMPDVNLENNNGDSALTFCISNNNIINLKLLLNTLESINFKNNKLVKVIIDAARNNFEVIIESLINFGLDPNTHQNNETILMIACKYGQEKICLLAVSKMVNLNFKNKDGDSALLIAIKNHKISCSKILIEAGCQVDIQNRAGINPLIIAIKESNHTLIKFLLTKNIKMVNQKDNNGNGALIHAVFKNDIKSIMLLFQECIIEIDQKNNQEQTALMLSIKFNYVEIAQLLMANGASQRGVDLNDMSCLNYAKLNKNNLIAKKIANGGDQELEEVKNRIISKLDGEIKYTESSIKENYFSNSNESIKNKNNLNNKFDTEKYYFKNKDKQFIPRFNGEYKLNKVLLENKDYEKNKNDDESLISLENMNSSPKISKEIEKSLLNNLIRQVEDKFFIKLNKEEIDKLEFEDIILSSTIRKKEKKEDKKKLTKLKNISLFEKSNE